MSVCVSVMSVCVCVCENISAHGARGIPNDSSSDGSRLSPGNDETAFRQNYLYNEIS